MAYPECTTTLGPEWIAAIFAGVAALVAVVEVRLRVLSDQRQATFAHLRQIGDALHALTIRDPGQLKEEVIAFYKGTSEALSEAGSRYLAFLDAMDLLSLAYHHKVVNRPIALEYLRGLLNDPRALSQAFITELRKATRDDTVYEHTLELIQVARASK